MNKIKITVITITYNAENVIVRTLDSVLKQTFPDIEHLIIDGASNDKTVSIATEYELRSSSANNGHEIKITSEPDNGLYDAMNKGIKLATGDYLCFLNAGDELHEDDTLQLMVHSITESTLPDVLYGDTAIVDEEGHFLHMRRLAPPENLNWKSFKQGMLVCHQAFFPRHTLIEPYDLQYRFSADFDWCIRIMKKARTFHNTHLILIDYLAEKLAGTGWQTPTT